MNIQPHKLADALGKKLHPVYLIFGEEPLQAMEACDQIRSVCRQSGYEVTERFQVDNARSFNWDELMMAGNSMSLFGDRKIVDLSIPSGKPGNEGSALLKRWCDDPPPDAVMLISAGKLEGRFRNLAWYKAIDSIGITVQTLPLSRQQTAQWIENRLALAGIGAEPEGVEMLTRMVEGNLLAAKQEIEKLAILYPQGQITPSQVLACVTDSSRYTIFDLLDSALQRQPGRALKVLDALRVAGDPPVLICWHLASEVRKIASVAAKTATGESASRAMMQAGIWKNRQSLVAAAMRSRPDQFWVHSISDCSYLDRLSKGQSAGELWDEISGFVARLAGLDWPLARSTEHV
jgi:DNA polymerase-3 subunit delta